MIAEEWKTLVAAMIRCDGGKGSEYYHAGDYFDAREAVLAALTLAAPLTNPNADETKD